MTKRTLIFQRGRLCGKALHEDLFQRSGEAELRSDYYAAVPLWEVNSDTATYLTAEIQLLNAFLRKMAEHLGLKGKSSPTKGYTGSCAGLRPALPLVPRQMREWGGSFHVISHERHTGNCR